MRTLLVVSQQSTLASAIHSLLGVDEYQVIPKTDVADAEMLLVRGAIDAVILDGDGPESRTVRAIESLRALAPAAPVVIYTGSATWEAEEAAYSLGVSHVLAKPVRGKLLATLLSRLFTSADAAPARAAVASISTELPARANGDSVRSLESLRRFSTVLTHSLDANSLIKQLLMPLREIMGVNRAIIFLRKPSTTWGEGPLSQEDRWLRSACAIGLEQSVLQHFALSLGAGIGGYLHREGRILRANSHEARSSREIAKEFQLLGGHVAIPILDRESLLGVAVLDERLTGDPYTNEELALVFHMLEDVGLAVRNSWRHGQLAANDAMIGDILGHIGSGCVVFGPNLSTLHANSAAMRYLAVGGVQKAKLEFSDLPQQIGSLVFAALKSGVGAPAFKFQFPGATDRWFLVEVSPFRTQAGTAENAALLKIEDITETERARRLEIETSNLRLVKSMAEHLAHEIGNSVVPLSTHQQMMKESMADPEFQQSLSGAMADGVKRISRLANQMMFLAREWEGDFRESVNIADLIVEAFHEAHAHHPGKKMAQLSFNRDLAPWKITGDHKALRHAFSEIILNALQANPEDPNVSVNLQEDRTGRHKLEVEVRDSGKGFSPEIAGRAPEPFFSTRTVGLGLGLTVSRRIIESHRGRIDISPSQGGESGIVRVSLPLPN